MDFNIFKILEKDDKELIHSAFLKFLFTEYKEFAENFIGIKLNENSIINLEKGYRYKKRKNGKSKLGRFDIEIINEKSIIIIENKFKSFPLSTQLKEYNDAISIIHPEKKLLKFSYVSTKEWLKTMKVGKYLITGIYFQ